MTAATFVLIALAALGHATWNTLVKTGGDKLVVQTVVIGAGGALCLLALPFVPVPAAASWPWLLASVAIHLAYFLCLTYAYEHGDLSQVYPISRGAAPALVAVLAWALAGEALSGREILGLVVVSAGIASLSRLPALIAGRAPARPGELRAVAFALLTALCIGGYSVADGLGGRLSGDVFGYIAWLFVLSALPLAALTAWRRRGRLVASFRPALRNGAAGGLVASLAYGIVIWALSVAPMAHVVALRETSVIVAAWIGTRMLGEPFGTRRVAAATLVAGGVALLVTGG